MVPAGGHLDGARDARQTAVSKGHGPVAGMPFQQKTAPSMREGAVFLPAGGELGDRREALVTSPSA